MIHENTRIFQFSSSKYISFIFSSFFLSIFYDTGGVKKNHGPCVTKGVDTKESFIDQSYPSRRKNYSFVKKKKEKNRIEFLFPHDK